jgi:hypothetical protein
MRTLNPEPWISNIEHRTPNTEHRTSNIEHRTSNEDGRRKTNPEPRASNEDGMRPPTPELRTPDSELRMQGACPYPPVPIPRLATVALCATHRPCSSRRPRGSPLRTPGSSLALVNALPHRPPFRCRRSAPRPPRWSGQAGAWRSQCSGPVPVRSWSSEFRVRERRGPVPIPATAY